VKRYNQSKDVAAEEKGQEFMDTFV